MNKYILVKIKGNYFNILFLNCLRNNIYLKKINYLTHDEILIEIKSTDYDFFKEISDYKITKVKDLGIINFINKINNNLHLIIATIVSIIIIFICSNLIIKVNVIHTDLELKRIIKLELDDYNIKVLRFKKSYDELQVIKNNIKDKYKDKIEWLEIIPKGMNYEVRIEERIINKDKPINEKCHIVAKKDAIVLEMLSSNGEKLININDYVNKGDILISGDIKLNEEIKQSICAEGTVYGEVWYEVETSIPLTKDIETLTGEKMFNISINKNKILRTKYKNYQTTKKNIFKGLDILVEYETKINTKKLNEEEAISETLNKIDETFKMRFNNKEEIITKNVLKKEVNNSTMKMVVFVVVKEIISTTVTY